jgi:small-conductance mechanosensitive channel
MEWPLGLDYLIPLAIVIGTLIFGYIFRGVLFSYLHRLAARTAWDVDDIIVGAIRGPFLIWVLMLGLYGALNASSLPDLAVETGSDLVLGLALFSISLTAANILAELMRRSAARAHLATPALIPNLIRAGMIMLGIMLMLSTLLGIDRIVPLLTAFGIGGLAVALALQDTLSNLFAGFYVTLAKQVRIGDYVKLETGQDGEVVDISWRATSVRDFSNNLIILPNAKLAQSIITNYHMPSRPVTVRIPVSVSYRSDPEHVEQVLLEIGQSALREIPELDQSFAPVVRFTNMGDFALDFMLAVRARSFPEQFIVQHQLRKRIFKRLREEGIEIPFPVRTIYLKDERSP